MNGSFASVTKRRLFRPFLSVLVQMIFVVYLNSIALLKAFSSISRYFQFQDDVGSSGRNIIILKKLFCFKFSVE